MSIIRAIMHHSRLRSSAPDFQVGALFLYFRQLRRLVIDIGLSTSQVSEPSSDRNLFRSLGILPSSSRFSFSFSHARHSFKGNTSYASTLPLLHLNSAIISLLPCVKSYRSRAFACLTQLSLIESLPSNHLQLEDRRQLWSNGKPSGHTSP